jgi:hypothetical protein
MASLVATVRNGWAATATDSVVGGAAAAGCGPSGSTTIGDATVDGTPMVVTLDGDPNDPTARIRVFVASGCALVVETSLGG